MAETVDLIISTKTEKLWSSSIHKQVANKRKSRDRQRIFKENELIDQGQTMNFSVRYGKLYKRDGNNG